MKLTDVEEKTYNIDELTGDTCKPIHISRTKDSMIALCGFRGTKWLGKYDRNKVNDRMCGTCLKLSQDPYRI